MTAVPLISVVIPTRSAGGVIGACLQSLERQTFRDFEVWVVDGGSTDDTLQVVQTHAAGLGAALHVHQGRDRGPYDGMNIGVSLARGVWLYFLGADDRIHDPDVFKDMASHMGDADLGILYGDVLMNNAGRRYGGSWTLDRLLHEANICHQAIFYRRDVFQWLGRFNLRYPVWADWEFNIRCFRHPELRTLWVDRVVADYNDKAGLSREEDPVLTKELPVTLLRDERRSAGRLCALVRRLREAAAGWLRF